ncbi:hypothetical protein [Mongoliitalea lutea]|nr:hypothetical protein [Mongoliitalea lutea]
MKSLKKILYAIFTILIISVDSDDLDHRSGYLDHPLIKGIQLPF